jgi:uncharacterized damage-inducible protein DinB
MDQVQQLLTIIDQAYDRKSWHGTNLRGSIRGLSSSDALWRPGPGRHNIWEIVVHAAYWKYCVCRRFSPVPRGSFARKGSNWFKRVSGASDAWRADVDLLEATHQTLRSAVAALRPADLSVTPRGSKVSNFDLLAGIAGHDLYHAGQIQLIKKLQTRGA